MQNAKFKMQNSECRIQNSECKMQNYASLFCFANRFARLLLPCIEGIYFALPRLKPTPIYTLAEVIICGTGRVKSSIVYTAKRVSIKSAPRKRLNPGGWRFNAQPSTPGWFPLRKVWLTEVESQRPMRKLTDAVSSVRVKFWQNSVCESTPNAIQFFSMLYYPLSRIKRICFSYRWFWKC